MEKAKGVQLNGTDSLGGYRLQPPSETPTYSDLGIDKWFDGGSEQPGSASFQFLKRARSDKAKLIGERYRPYTYQAIVWQRLYQANGEWVLKTALTAGLDTPWPHRIPIHLQKDGERGGRWKVDIEKTRVRMTDVKVTANLPEEEKKQ